MTKPLPEHLQEARRACLFSQDVRAHHRRRSTKGAPQREFDLQQARDKLSEAMAPIRSYIGRTQYEKPTELRRQMHARYSKASNALQIERRKVWKMQQPPPKQKRAFKCL